MIIFHDVCLCYTCWHFPCLGTRKLRLNGFISRNNVDWFCKLNKCVWLGSRISLPGANRIILTGRVQWPGVCSRVKFRKAASKCVLGGGGAYSHVRPGQKHTRIQSPSIMTQIDLNTQIARSSSGPALYMHVVCILLQGMVDGSASKPALRQDNGYMVEKTYLDIAPYLGAFGAYLMPQ